MGKPGLQQVLTSTKRITLQHLDGSCQEPNLEPVEFVTIPKSHIVARKPILPRRGRLLKEELWSVAVQSTGFIMALEEARCGCKEWLKIIIIKC